MSDLRAAAQQVLEALMDAQRHNYALKHTDTDDLITALRAALAQEALKDLAEADREIEESARITDELPSNNPLTDEEIDRITDQQWDVIDHKPIYSAHRAYARAIERAHGIRENE